MDMKINRNYSVYQSTVNSRYTEKDAAAGKRDGKVQAGGDAVCFSSRGARKSEASSFASALTRSMEQEAGTGRLETLKNQIEAGTYEVSAKQIAMRLLKGQ